MYPSRFYFIGGTVLISVVFTSMSKKLPCKVALAWGAWDLFHIGHLNLIRNAKELCDRLIVCVSTDEYIRKNKGHLPITPFSERLMIVGAIRYVDAVDRQDETFSKKDAIKQYKPDLLVVGDDWAPDTFTGEGMGVPVAYLPYTKHISSTLLRERLSENK